MDNVKHQSKIRKKLMHIFINCIFLLTKHLDQKTLDSLAFHDQIDYPKINWYFLQTRRITQSHCCFNSLTAQNGLIHAISSNRPVRGYFLNGFTYSS